MSHGKDVKERILNAGLILWPDVSSRSIGRYLDMSHSNILYHFGDANGLKNAIAKHAIHECKSHIIVQLIASNHPSIKDMAFDTRQSHIQNSKVLFT